MFRRPSPNRFDIALFAALWLVVQVVSGFASGANAAPVPLDAFGNPLCVTSADSDGSSQRHDDGAAPCCTLACAMAAANLVPAPDQPALKAPLSAGLYLTPPAYPVAVSRPLERVAANPRAPPGA